MNGELNEINPLIGVLGEPDDLYGSLDGPLTRGYSAYEIYLEHGGTMTVEEWLASLKGAKGDEPAITTQRTGSKQTTIYADGEQIGIILDGEEGDPGEPGDDGFSPTVETAAITGGHSVTITDASGPHTFNVMDGQDGAPGADGKDGQDGKDGSDGYTPVKGTDYWTSADKAEMEQDILQSQTVTDMQDEITQLNGDLTKKYEKPSGGIPASDLASGVIPEVPVQDVQVNGTSVLNNGVADVPRASSSGYGVVRTQDSRGTYISTEGYLAISRAYTPECKNGSNGFMPIVPVNQHESTFYGLAKAAGDSTQSASSNAVGTYTEEARSKISQMLDAPVTVSGTTPTITGKAGIRYICGEVATLDITLPASGIVDVVFTSGSTATVLTITPPTGKTMTWANGFDPTALEANKIYEINIMDGCLGVAGVWT